MKKINNANFAKVLFIGPDLKGKGGIASVLASYRHNFEPFHYLPTNSRHGKIPGYFNVIFALFRLPLARLKGRKILHVHYATGKSWYRKQIVMSWARLWGYRVVAHCHGNSMKQFSQRIGYNKVRKELDKSKANIVLSEEWKEFFENYIQCDNLSVINNIVDRPENIKTVSESEAVKPTFLFLGALGKRKGIFDILAAMARLRAEGRSFRFIVGGNGEVQKFKSEVQRLGLEDVVDYRGWIDPKTKKKVLSESDVLLLPSYNEGLPIAILEAMSYGKAVVSTPVGGIPRVLTNGKNGFLVTPGSVDEIEQALQQYVSNPSLAEQQGQESKEIVKDFYAETVAEQLLQVYDKVLSEN